MGWPDYTRGRPTQPPSDPYGRSREVCSVRPPDAGPGTIHRLVARLLSGELGHPAHNRKYRIQVPRPFEILCEIEPATRPDLTHVRHQIGVLSPVADSFLIPDNHIGRSTVSSIAVAREVQLMGGQ